MNQFPLPPEGPVVRLPPEAHVGPQEAPHGRLRLGLAPGTWGADDPLYSPDSLWCRWLGAHGITVRRLFWTTHLGGFGPSRHDAWRRAAEAWAAGQATDPVDAWLLHSHAGQAGALAIAEGAVVPLLVMCCTPNRHDLAPVYWQARARMDVYGGTWRCLAGGRRDVMGRLGALLDGAISAERIIPAAHAGVTLHDRGHGAGEWFSPSAWDLRWLRP